MKDNVFTSTKVQRCMQKRLENGIRYIRKCYLLLLANTE